MFTNEIYLSLRIYEGELWQENDMILIFVFVHPLSEGKIQGRRSEACFNNLELIIEAS